MATNSERLIKSLSNIEEGVVTSKLSSDSRKRIEGMKMMFLAGISELLYKDLDASKADKISVQIEKILKKI